MHCGVLSPIVIAVPACDYKNNINDKANRGFVLFVKILTFQEQSPPLQSKKQKQVKMALNCGYRRSFILML